MESNKTWELQLCLESQGLVVSFWWVQLAVFLSVLKLHCVLYSTSKWSGCLLWNNCDRRRKREESQHWLWTFQTNQYIVVFVWQQIPHRGKKSPIACWSCSSQSQTALLDSLEQSLVCLSPQSVEQQALIKTSCWCSHWMACDWLVFRNVWCLLKAVQILSSSYYSWLYGPASNCWVCVTHRQAFLCNWRQFFFS